MMIFISGVFVGAVATVFLMFLIALVCTAKRQAEEQSLDASKAAFAASKRPFEFTVKREGWNDGRHEPFMRWHEQPERRRGMPPADRVTFEPPERRRGADGGCE